MRYISIFSGIEAASVAWEPLGWEPVAFSEIDEFPSAVLRARYPNVPNLGDITKVDWSPYRGTVDLVVGGSPCQAFSIAGKRQGLLDERGQLMLEYVRAVAEIEPRWFIWENVPGSLSQDRGRAFGTLLREMDELGYGMAWRILDAQFFGVAQRRRRVFLVGRAGEGGGAAAAVLFEPESVSGNTTSSKEKRQALAADARSSPAGSGGGVTAFAQNTRDEVRVQGDGTISGALAAQPGMKQQTYVAEARAYRSNQLPCPICRSESVVSIDDPQEPEMFWHYSCGCSQLGCELYGRFRKSFDSREDAIADWNKSVLLDCYSVDYKQTPKVNDQLCHTLTHEGDGGIHSAVAYNECLTQWDVQSKRVSTEESCSPTLQAGTHEGQNIQPVVMVAATQDQTLFQPDSDSYIVRRLTPTECERLQGFPDGWTDIGEWTDSRGKRRKTTDGNRYKALGNSFAVPVVRWLGERIERTNMSEISNNYRKARMAAGIRAESAASSFGVSITTLFSWERGDTKPNGDHICAMARLYKVSTDYLLGMSD